MTNLTAEKDVNGLVLEGGGTKGAYHLGVVKAMKELDVGITAVTGTSIGALNGAMIAMGHYDEMYDIWYNMSVGRIVGEDQEVIKDLVKDEYTAKDLANIFKTLRMIIKKGGLDVAPFHEMVEKYVDEEKLRSSPIRFGLVTVSLTDFKPFELFIEDIPEGKVREYLIASANLPVFKQERLDDKWLIDGGFYDNLPIRLISRDERINKIYAVETLGRAAKKKPDTDIPIIRISPSEDLGRTLDFDVKRARKNLKMGYWDFMRVYCNYLGSRYCIDVFEENEILNYLLSFSAAEIGALEDFLNIEGTGMKRSLFEQAVPKIGRVLKMGESVSYRDFAVELLEWGAGLLDVDPYKLYTIKEFAETVKAALADKLKKRKKEGSKEPEEGFIKEFLKQEEIFIGSLKDDFIIEVLVRLLRVSC